CARLVSRPRFAMKSIAPSGATAPATSCSMRLRLGISARSKDYRAGSTAQRARSASAGAITSLTPTPLCSLPGSGAHTAKPRRRRSKPSARNQNLFNRGERRERREKRGSFTLGHVPFILCVLCGKSLHEFAPGHFLYFLPLPQGQGSLRQTFSAQRTTCS